MENSVPDAAVKSSAFDTELVAFGKSSIHGIGGFAKTMVAAGTRLLKYDGERIDKQESIRRCEHNNVYIFALDDLQDIDGDVPWNLARYLNHSCTANCEAQLQGGHIWLVANRDIRAGEELTFNYGFDLENYRDYPCCCGSPECVGFIVAEALFDHVRSRSEAGLGPREP